MRTYGVGVRGGFLVVDGWVSLVDNFWESRLRRMRYVSCGCIEDFRDSRESAY